MVVYPYDNHGQHSPQLNSAEIYYLYGPTHGTTFLSPLDAFKPTLVGNSLSTHQSIWTAAAGHCVSLSPSFLWGTGFSRSTTLPPSFTVNSGIVNHTHSRMGSIMSTGVVQGMSTPRVLLCPSLHFMQCSPTSGSPDLQTHRPAHALIQRDLQ